MPLKKQKNRTWNIRQKRNNLLKNKMSVSIESFEKKLRLNEVIQPRLEHPASRKL
jgi:hypothetical protein